MKIMEIIEIMEIMKITNIGLVAVTITITGCSDNQPTRLAWISVEKPPIKVIYIDRQGELDPAITKNIFNIVGKTRYKSMKLNENTNISSHASGHQSDIEVDTDVASLSID